MAIGADRVQVFKIESTALGGKDADDLTGGPVPIRAQEDAIESSGWYVQDESNRDEDIAIFRDGDDLTFKDKTVSGEKTLAQLAAGGGYVGHPFNVANGETLTIPVDLQFDNLGRFGVSGRLVIDGRFVLGIGAKNG